jgi:hypothetical protein
MEQGDMSNLYGPRIVTDGLVLHLDAGNRKSYPGSSTAWNDLSGNDNHATLSTGPVFSSANNGNFYFGNTSDDYAEVTTRNTNLEFQPTSPHSIITFIKSPSSGFNGPIIANMYQGNNGTYNYPGWDFWFNNSGQTNSISSHYIKSWATNAIKVIADYNYTTNSNKWVMLGLTYDGSCPANTTNTVNSIDFYFNGDLITSGKTYQIGDGFDNTNQTIVYDTNQRLRIASRWYSGSKSHTGSVYAPFSMGTIMVYNNKKLSEDEIRQNYNALKGRFGL